MTIPPRRGALVVALAGTVLLALPAEGPAQEAGAREMLRQVMSVREQANTSGSETQKRIDALSGETDILYARYQSAAAQVESLRKFNEGMRKVIAEQDARLDHLTGQLGQVDEVARSVTPLMLRMIDALERFVALDLPFLAAERAERVADLRRLMGRADVTVSEKYRRIMEAYQIEHEYGRTIEAYRAPLDGGETVDFLRFGRIALAYVTLDQGRAGLWDPRAREWTRLDASFVGDLREGLRIARKQVAPDLITLPLPEPASAGAEG